MLDIEKILTYHWHTQRGQVTRIDFYADNSTSGIPHVLGFNGDNYRFCVLFDPAINKFLLQIYHDGVGNNPWDEEFEIDAQRNRWYTIEIEKGSSGKCAAWVYERGDSRNYMDTIAKAGFLTNWNCYTLSAGNGNSFYLTNYYAGSYSQTTSYTDGNGRTLQTQVRNGTADLVAIATYDSAGRADKQWRSFQYNTNHSYDPYAKDEINDEYGENYSYAQAEFERSPLSRILKQKPLGAILEADSNEHISYSYGNATIEGQECTYVQTRSKANSDVPWVITRNYADKLGRSIKTASYEEGQAEDIVSRTSYTMLGQPYQVIDPESLETTIQYDYLGRVKQKTTPDGGTSKYVYDKAGRLRFMADAVALASTKILYWKYDILGRVTEKGYINGGWTETFLHNWAENTPSYPSTPTTWRKQFSYGSTRLAASAGRLIKAVTNNDDVTDVEVEELFSYDYDGNVMAKGLRVYEYDYSSRSALYAYDHLGRVKSMGYPSSISETVTYGYDQLGRVVSVGDGTISNAYAGYTYTSEGKLYHEILNNNGTQVKYFGYDYDARGRVKQVGGSGAMIQFMGYSNIYNGSMDSTFFYYNSMTGKPSNLYNYTYNFHYDKYGRLDIADNSKDDSHDIGVGFEKETKYDKNGNIRTMRRAGVDKSYNLIEGKNQVLNTDGSGTDYQYDQNGNMIVASARTTPVNITYDVFTNMTMQVIKTSTGRKQKYQYDARNVRVMKMDDSTWSTLYLHGLNNYPLVEKTSTTERIYIYGPTGLIIIKEGTSKRYVQKDHLGSTRVLYSEIGEAVMVYEYDAYGKCIARLENSQAKYRFTGQEYESESELYNFRARMYDDDLVGFYAVDPANQGFAPYSYCLGNPIMFVDPTGRLSIDEVLIRKDEYELIDWDEEQRKKEGIGIEFKERRKRWSPHYFDFELNYISGKSEGNKSTFSKIVSWFTNAVTSIFSSKSEQLKNEQENQQSNASMTPIADNTIDAANKAADVINKAGDVGINVGIQGAVLELGPQSSGNASAIASVSMKGNVTMTGEVNVTAGRQKIGKISYTETLAGKGESGVQGGILGGSNNNESSFGFSVAGYGIRASAKADPVSTSVKYQLNVSYNGAVVGIFVKTPSRSSSR